MDETMVYVVLCARSQRQEHALCTALGLTDPMGVHSVALGGVNRQPNGDLRYCYIRSFENAALRVTALPLGRPYQLAALNTLMEELPMARFLVVDVTLTDRHLVAAFGRNGDRDRYRITLIDNIQALEAHTQIPIENQAQRNWLCRETRLRDMFRIRLDEPIYRGAAGSDHAVVVPFVISFSQSVERPPPLPLAPELSPAARAKLAEGWQGVLKEPTPTDNEEAQCIGCYTHWASIVFVPCGHQVFCDACARALCEKAKRACPICREAIPQIVRLHEQRPRPANATDSADVERDQVSPRASDTGKHQASDSGGSLSPPRKKRRR